MACFIGEVGMNKSITSCISLMTLLFSTFCVAPPAQERYLQANKLYEQGEYAQALALYEGIARKGPAVLVNMGNAAFEQSHFVQALIAWRRAQLQLKPRLYYMIEQRITEMQSQEGGQYSRGFIERLAVCLDVYMRVLPHKVWQLLFFILLAVGLFVLRWLRQRNWALLLIWGSMLLVVSMLLMVRYRVRSRVMGVVTRDAHLLVSKDTHSRSKKRLLAGQEVRVTSEQDAWYQVTYATDIGWTPHDTIQIIIIL